MVITPVKLLCFFATFSVSIQASDEPPLAPTNSPSASLSLSVPTSPPSATIAPSDPGFCSNTQGFSVTEWNRFHRQWHLQTLGCDDILVDCHEWGNLGQVQDHCCKCREECDGQCNDPVYTQPEPRFHDSDASSRFYAFFVPAACMVGLLALFGLYMLRKKERRIAEENMIARLQEQERRENNGLTEEENAIRRFEQFVTKFYFQTVLADKSNISAESIRKSNSRKDEEAPTEKSTSVDDSDASGEVDQPCPSGKTISEQLVSWATKSCAKQECCICLDAYSEGDTICVPVTKSCNHVFHESCIKEWLKKNDQCPLCRVDLISD